jgi:Cdc6-like AAA superfamily ATPase
MAWIYETAMSLFKDMLGSGESLFKNPVALDYDFIPKLIPYRENEQFKMAACVKPLFQERNGRNLIIWGNPGVGKTVACRHVLADLGEQTEEIVPFYVNCWSKNTSFKIAIELCEQLGYKLTHNKKTDELMEIAIKILNKSSSVLVFDEIDKVEDFDFLYSLLEGVYRKSIILITNYREWSVTLDERIRSRLLPEILEFRPYNLTETRGILKSRIEAGVAPGVFDDECLEVISQKTSELCDIRSGLYLIREAINIAEDKSLKKVSLEFVKEAISKLDEFKTKKKDDLEEETQKILDIVKKNSGKKIGDLFKVYQDNGGTMVYKSFQRKIAKLESGRFISVEKTTGGKDGTTSIISYSDTPKKLTDY